MHRCFSLFNVERWSRNEEGRKILSTIQDAGLRQNINVVPVLYEGPWIHDGLFTPHRFIAVLKQQGSAAVPNYMKPEGIVVYHKASRTCFKITIEKDNEFKNVKSS